MAERIYIMTQKSKTSPARAARLSERQITVLAMLLQGPATVKQLERRTNANNSPEIIAGLRRKGYAIHTELRDFVTKEGKRSKLGVYHLMPESAARAAEAVKQGGTDA